MQGKAARAIFLDRDGVLNLDSGYVFRTADLKVLPGVPEALQELKTRNFLLIVITNQSSVARGLCSERDVDTFNSALAAEIEKMGGPAIDAFYVCPHHPKGSVTQYAIHCHCRKPAPGLIERAVRDFGIDAARSWMIGDKDSDAACGRNAGVRPILVDSGKYALSDDLTPRVASLSDALAIIS